MMHFFLLLLVIFRDLTLLNYSNSLIVHQVWVGSTMTPNVPRKQGLKRALLRETNG